MNEGSGSTRISIRLADGEYFPVFRHGDQDFRSISLVPARQGQAEADIQFYHHSSDGSEPESIGVVRFPDLPEDSAGAELQLEAEIDSSGRFSATVSHQESGRSEHFETALPEAAVSSEPPVSTGYSEEPETAFPTEESGRFRWFFGVVFVALGLALVFWLTLMVTDWGRQDPLPPPVSMDTVTAVESEAV
jgi:hypothetical protein